MRRRTHSIRDARFGPDSADSPGLRAILLLSAVAFILLQCGFTAQAQSNAPHNANSSPADSGAPTRASARITAANNFAQLPLSFEENRGQTDPRAKFLSRGPGYTLFFTDREAVFAFPSHAGGSAQPPAVLHLRFDHADPRAHVSGRGILPGKTNYFLSADRSTWRSGIRNYSSLAYHQIYPGIDAVFRGSPQRLEFDCDLAPGADPSKIVLDIAGGRTLRVNQDGDIVLRVGQSDHGGEVTLGRPVAYQEIAGARHEIQAKFVLRGERRLGFQLGTYDRARPLVIDPTLSYSTYLAGNFGQTTLYSVAVDSSGSAYVAGFTEDSTFPGPSGSTPVPNSYADFVAKFTPDGSALDYLTFLPPGSQPELALDPTDSAYVSMQLSQIYLVGGGYQNPNVGASGYNSNQLTAIKLSTDGSEVVYAAQIAGISADLLGVYANIAVDSQGSAYVVTGADDTSYYPTTTNAYQTGLVNGLEMAGITKLSADGTSLTYSSLLGSPSGAGAAQALAVTVDAAGDAYVVGATDAPDFPVTSGAVESACTSFGCGFNPAFITKLNPDGSALLYSTYFGSGLGEAYEGIMSDIGPAIAVDGSGNAYVAGTASPSIANFASAMNPEISGPMATVAGYEAGDNYGALAFLGKISSDGTQLLYLALLGDNNTTLAAGSPLNGYAGATSVAVDTAGNAYLTGLTTSEFFPVTSDAYQSTQLALCSSYGCNGEAFYSILNTTVAGNASLVYSTYLGAASSGSNSSIDEGSGIALDPAGNAYLTGVVNNGGFPTTAGAFQATGPAGGGGFLTKFSALTGTSAAAISAVSGGGQSAAIGQAFANPLEVNVTDANGNPVSGATVTFSAPASGASATLSSATATTNSSGNASVSAAANGIASSTAYQVSASVAGVNVPATFSLMNAQASTSLAVTPSATSLTYGQSVTITAAISPTSVDGTAPTGSVTFYDGTTPLTPNSAVSAGSASYTVSEPSVGSHTYSAQYLGDSNFVASALTAAASAVTVTAASAPIMVTDSETITESDTEIFPGVVDPETITVADTYSVMVGEIPTATTLSITPSPASSGQPVTFTATVTPTAGTGEPTGTVTFSCQPQSVSSGAITLSSGLATWTTTSLAPLTYSGCFIATYSGDSTFQQSASAAASLTVTDFSIAFQNPPNLVLSPGQSTSFSFTIAPAGGAYSGTVTFDMTGLPAGVTATFNPATVTPGNNSTTVTATLAASASAAADEPASSARGTGPLVFALLLPLVGPLLRLGCTRRRLRSGGWLMLLALLSFLALIGVSSCGGNSGSSTQSPQTYTVTLTATSGSAQHSTTFELTLK